MRTSLRDPERAVRGAVPVVLGDGVLLRMAKPLERRGEPLVVGREPEHAGRRQHGESPLDQVAMVALHVEVAAARIGERGRIQDAERSEEHTSELQSLAYLVC